MTPAPERPARQRVSDWVLADWISEFGGRPLTVSQNGALDLRDARATIAGLREENERLKGEAAKARSRQEFCEQWYAERMPPLEQLMKDAGIWDKGAAIIANASADGYPPTYAQQLNIAKQRATRAEAVLARLTQPDEAMVETAARALCVHHGINPDDPVPCRRLASGMRVLDEHSTETVPSWQWFKRKDAEIALAARPAPETSATRDNVRTADAIATARQDEREACAQVAEAQAFYPDTNIGMRQQWVKDQIAAAIRARKDEP